MLGLYKYFGTTNSVFITVIGPYFRIIDLKYIQAYYNQREKDLLKKIKKENDKATYKSIKNLYNISLLIMDIKRYRLYNALCNKYIDIEIEEIMEIAKARNKVNNTGY